MSTITWLVQQVPVDNLAFTLTDLEVSHPPISPPIIVYIDQGRVLVMWRWTP